jgi:hypothetical protein
MRLLDAWKCRSASGTKQNRWWPGDESTDGQIVWKEYLIGAFNNALLRKSPQNGDFFRQQRLLSGQCRLMAPNGDSNRTCGRLLSGAKRTLPRPIGMSANDPQRTSAPWPPSYRCLKHNRDACRVWPFWFAPLALFRAGSPPSGHSGRGSFVAYFSVIAVL